MTSLAVLEKPVDEATEFLEMVKNQGVRSASSCTTGTFINRVCSARRIIVALHRKGKTLFYNQETGEASFDEIPELKDLSWVLLLAEQCFTLGNDREISLFLLENVEGILKEYKNIEAI